MVVVRLVDQQLVVDAHTLASPATRHRLQHQVDPTAVAGAHGGHDEHLAVAGAVLAVGTRLGIVADGHFAPCAGHVIVDVEQPAAGGRLLGAATEQHLAIRQFFDLGLVTIGCYCRPGARASQGMPRLAEIVAIEHHATHSHGAVNRRVDAVIVAPLDAAALADAPTGEEQGIDLGITGKDAVDVAGYLAARPRCAAVIANVAPHAQRVLQCRCQETLIARGAHDEQFSRLAVNNRCRIAVAVVKTLVFAVPIGNHDGIAPRPAAVIAGLAQDVDARIAADVRVVAMPVVTNSEQPAVLQLHNGRDAVIAARSDFGVKHRHRHRIALAVRRCGDLIAQNHLDYLVGIGNVHLSVAVHVAVDALCDGRL